MIPVPFPTPLLVHEQTRSLVNYFVPRTGVEYGGSVLQLCSICFRIALLLLKRRFLRALIAMSKPRRTATFTFDHRGWASLYKHIAKELDTKRLDKELFELHLTGSKLKTQSDVLYFSKIMSMFTNIKTIMLNEMGLVNLDVLGQLLCTRFSNTKLLDISGNNVSKDTLKKFIDALQGRSVTKDVPPLWLAIGDMPEFYTTNFTCCNPHIYGGCRCNSKRVVHIGNDLNALMFHTKAVAKQCPKAYPPPPIEPPPPPPLPFMSSIVKFGDAKSKFKTAFEAAKSSWNVITAQDKEFVLVQSESKFTFADFMDIDSGCVPSINGGALLQLKDLCIIPGGPSGIIQVTTLPYNVEDFCTTPDSYLFTKGGESIWIQTTSYAEGWVAASFDQFEWKWFPLAMCSP